MRINQKAIYVFFILTLMCPRTFSQPGPLIDGGLFYFPVTQSLISPGGWGIPSNWDPVKTVWSLSGAGWTALPSLPIGITHNGGTYNPSTKQLVILGGTTQLHETYAFDGTAWKKIADPLTTSIVGGDPEMIYDPVLQKIVMYYAGYSGAAAANSETYFLEKQGWVKQALTPAPPAGADNGFVYDSAHKEGVWFNGEQTWTWNHTQWTKKTPANQPGKSPGFFGLAYDSSKSVTVLFGNGETWTWDGTNWTKLASVNSPTYPSRGFFSMGYDEKRQVTVLWGGELTTDPKYPDDIWEWDGKVWKPFAITPVPEWGQY